MLGCFEIEAFELTEQGNLSHVIENAHESLSFSQNSGLQQGAKLVCDLRNYKKEMFCYLIFFFFFISHTAKT